MDCAVQGCAVYSKNWMIVGATLCLSATSFAQIAVLHDGRVVTQKVPLEIYATEGPVWDINVPNRTLRVTGRHVTIPASVNGIPFEIEGTEVLDADGNSLGMLNAENFERLTDIRAANDDRVLHPACASCGPLRIGPTRSIFSTSEARGDAVNDGEDYLDRMPVVQRVIEDNYFFIARNIYNRHVDVLPVSWLGRIGIRNADGSYPESATQLPLRRHWRYPFTTGGTLKSAGHVYVDEQGNEYLIPDLERAFELSENVCIGKVRSVQFGDAFTPDSFIVGDTAVVMNQDPRFSAAIIGIAGSPVDREYFFSNLTPDTEIAVGGFMVGEHLQMAQEIEVGMYDPANGITISADRFRVQVGDGQIQFQGQFIPSTGLTLWAEVAGIMFLLPTTPDKAIAGLSLYRFREDGLPLKGVTSVKLIARDELGAIVHEVTHEIPPDAIAP